MKRAIVTGAAGFIGSFLCAQLVRSGEWQVLGYDNLSPYYDVSLKQARLQAIHQADKAGAFSFQRSDLCDAEALERAFVQMRPDVVVNLAAQAGVRHSLHHPHEYIQSNIVGFLNVLEQCRAQGTPHLVYASSSSVYGDTATAPFSEYEPCNQPVSLYAATKKADEMMAHAYSSLYGLRCTGLRFFTVYGPMGRPDMAYFSFAQRMADGQPIQLFNQGDMLRDFTYVDDIVKGIMLVMDPPPTAKITAPCRVFNIGHGDPVPLIDFVDTLEAALRDAGVLTRPAVREYLPMQAGDVHRTYADTSALEREYGYAPNTPLAVGLAEFARWFAQYRGASPQVQKGIRP